MNIQSYIDSGEYQYIDIWHREGQLIHYPQGGLINTLPMHLETWEVTADGELVVTGASTKSNIHNFTYYNKDGRRLDYGFFLPCISSIYFLVVYT